MDLSTSEKDLEIIKIKEKSFKYQQEIQQQELRFEQEFLNIKKKGELDMEADQCKICK